LLLRRLKILGKKGAHRLGVDVRGIKHTEKGILRALLARLPLAALLDVGANVGQYARLVRSAGYGGTIISFEALESAHALLTKNAHKDRSWLVAPCAAVGSQEGTVEMNVAADSASSSVLPMTSLLRQAAPQAAYIDRQSICSTRLDTYAGVPAAGELYLKVDTQGFELEVLRGASGLLSRISAVQLELSLVPLYQGAPAMTDLIHYLDERGFDLFQLVPGFLDDRDGRLLQAGGFFVRRESRAG
jgi:FkbM family methyltransferase